MFLSLGKFQPLLDLWKLPNVCHASTHILASLSLMSQAFLIMDGEDIPDFSSLKEETAYWKELSLKYKQR